MKTEGKLSKHTSIGFYKSQVSENNAHYVPVLGFTFFSGTQRAGLCLKANCGTRDKNCDTSDAAFFDLFFLTCIFRK